MMEVQKLLEFYRKARSLKFTYRYSQSSFPMQESTAAHSWRLCLMAMTLSKDIDVNTEHALKIAIVHDLAEAMTGDVDYSLVANGKILKAHKQMQEEKAIGEIAGSLPEDTREELIALWNEYEQGSSREARFIKALDKLEGIAHILEMGTSFFPHLEILPEYADSHVRSFPELLPVLKELKLRLKEEFKKAGLEWLEKYDYSL